MVTQKQKTNTGSESRDLAISRRAMLAGVAGTAIGLTSCTTPGTAPTAGDRAVKKGRINQSIALWCFEKYCKLHQPQLF